MLADDFDSHSSVSSKLVISRISLLLILFLVIAGGQVALADSAPTQPLLGFAWPTRNIPVHVNSSLLNATRAAVNAMLTWNLAQQWFITTYMGGKGKPFVFYQTNSSSDSMVAITFNQTQTVDDLGRTTSQEFHDQQGVFAKVLVKISIDLAWKNGKPLTDVELQTLATHELGHALGLDHTTFSDSDLMNHVPTVMFPSTLNLYAVYFVSQSTSINDLPQQPVALPGIIPYTTVSQSDLESVSLSTVQVTSSESVSQFATVIAYGPWPYLGFFAALATVVVILTIRSRKRRVGKFEMNQSQVIFQEKPAIGETVQQDPIRKKCRHCGAQISRTELICRSCGMPAYLDPR